MIGNPDELGLYIESVEFWTYRNHEILHLKDSLSKVLSTFCPTPVNCFWCPPTPLLCLRKGKKPLCHPELTRLPNCNQSNWPPFKTPLCQCYAKSSAWETSTSMALAIADPRNSVARLVTSVSVKLFHSHVLIPNRLFLNEKIDVVDSKRGKFLVRTLESHEQSTKRNVRLATRY